PSRRRPYSGAIGSLTLSRSSESAHTSSTLAMRAPAPSYAESGNALPSPAPVSTSTSCPFCTSSRAPAGVSATRYSSVLISLATPIRKTRGTLAAVTLSKEEQKPRECLRVLDLPEPPAQVRDRPADDLE